MIWALEAIIASDSQAMGRVGEVIIPTWQTAHKMKIQRGRLPEETGENDNMRVNRISPNIQLIQQLHMAFQIISWLITLQMTVFRKFP